MNASSVFFTVPISLFFLASPCFGQPLPPEKAVRPIKEIEEIKSRYDNSKPANAKLANPGLRVLYFCLSENTLNLAGWNPWTFCRDYRLPGRVVYWAHDSRWPLPGRIAPLFWFAGESGTVHDLWFPVSRQWGEVFKLECNSWKGERWSELTLPSGCGYGDYIERDLRVRGMRTGLHVEEGMHWGNPTGLAKVPTRHYRQKIKEDGEVANYEYVEAVIKLPYFEKNRIVSLSGGPKVAPAILQRTSTHRIAVITLRLCPESNWYYASANFGDGAIGPGWRQAPSNAVSGRGKGLLHTTDMFEEYWLIWEKRIERSGGEMFVGRPQPVK